ncbi:hypothetical protein [Methylobacterium oxalidis]|uniref:Uncharacterized protein n=1 Tax=Methylobacterium oxalidis TaxID=944322 RepID=A0A512IZE3_9HYPH|nr:hypothetical protein [Methylobacterium oxalidis]GEP03072.1 hypothetical protein MOX02_11100 [Methylobacterium oxalidis]GJE32838.1 hypothetical protein LDDCCGHA_3034 [Methylobacterium oxalidis]GLS67331.1 hypothetical protein GCM10007888_57150 [Methylobacterium oxalidis]
MALPRSKPPAPPDRNTRRDLVNTRRDLVPDEASDSYRFIETAAREGTRVSTEGLSDEAAMAALRGKPRRR